MSANIVKLQALMRGSLTRKRLRRDPHFSRLFHRPRKSLVAASMYDGMSLDELEHGDLLEYSRRRYDERKRERGRKKEEKKQEDCEELGLSDSNEGEERADPLLSPSAGRPVTIPDSLSSEHSKHPPSELQPSDLSALSRPSVSGTEEGKSANRCSDLPLSAASEEPRADPHTDEPTELFTPVVSSQPTYEPDSEQQVQTTFSPCQLAVIERSAESPVPNEDFMSAAEAKAWGWEVGTQRDSPEPEAPLISAERQQESTEETPTPLVEAAKRPVEGGKAETEANLEVVSEPQMQVEATLDPVEKTPPAQPLAPVEETKAVTEANLVSVEDTPNPIERATTPAEARMDIVEATPAIEVEVSVDINPEGDVKAHDQVTDPEAAQEQMQEGIDIKDNPLYSPIEKQAENTVVEEAVSGRESAEVDSVAQPGTELTVELEPKDAENTHFGPEPEALSQPGASPSITPTPQPVETREEQEPIGMPQAQVKGDKEEEKAVIPGSGISETASLGTGQKSFEMPPEVVARAETPPALDGEFPTFAPGRKNRMELPETDDEPERPMFTPAFATQKSGLRDAFEPQSAADDTPVTNSPPAIPRGSAPPFLESLSREGIEHQPAPVPPGIDYSSIRSAEEEPAKERRSARDKDASPPPEHDQMAALPGAIFPAKPGEVQPTFRVDTPQVPNERQTTPQLTGSPSLTAVGSGQPSFRTPSFSTTPKTPYMGSRDLHKVNLAGADTPVKTVEEAKVSVLVESLKGLESAGKERERSLSESSESVQGRQRHSSVQETEKAQGAGTRLQLSSKVQRTIPHPPQRPRPLQPTKSRSRDASLSLVASDTSNLSKTSFKSPSNARQGLNQTLPTTLQKKHSREIVHLADISKEKGKSTLYQHRRTQTPEQRLVPISGVKKWASPYDFQWSKRMLERVFRIGVEMKNKQATYFPEMKVRKLRKSRVKHWEDALKVEMEMVSQIDDAKV